MPNWLVGVFYASLICSTLAQQPAPEEAAIRQALASSFAAPSPESELAASLTLAQLCGVPYTPFPSAELAATVGNVQRVNTTNSEIAYLRFGNTTSSRPPIVYISGFGSTISELPLNLALSLAQDQEFIAFDNRGQGLSTDTNPNVPITIESMANDTAEFIRALNLTKPTIWGYSMGGMIATALLVQHGDVAGLGVVAHGTAGGPNSTVPTLRARQILTDPQSSMRDIFSIGYNLSDPMGRDAACIDYRDTMQFPVRSPSNLDTKQRQTDALTQWVS